MTAVMINGRGVKNTDKQADVQSRDGVLRDCPRPQGQNFVTLVSDSKTAGLGHGLENAVIEHISGTKLTQRERVSGCV